MKIKQTPLAKIKPYAQNAKEHPQSQIDQIINSIKEFGFNDPIAIDEEGIIIEGHGRLLAAEQLNMEEVPTITLSHLNEQQKRAYIIAHNKLTLNTGFDMDVLLKELTNLYENGFDLLLTGFDELELDELKIGFVETIIDYDKADEVPTVDEENVVIEHGDIVELNEHIILCGDATKKEDIEKLLKGINLKKSIVHFLSDPPYGIAYDPKLPKYGMIKNDDTFLNFIPLAKKYTNGFFMIWTSYQVVDEWLKRVKKSFKKITNMIIWHKGGGGMGDCARTLATDYEIALVVNRGNQLQSGRGSAVWQYQNDVKKEFVRKSKKAELQNILEHFIDGETLWKVKKDNTATYLHPTQKPVEINERALLNFTKKDDFVCDFFTGSGSNLIACENMGRKFRGMELDTKYMQVIVERWCEYTSVDTIVINGQEVSWVEYKEEQI